MGLSLGRLKEAAGPVALAWEREAADRQSLQQFAAEEDPFVQEMLRFSRRLVDPRRAKEREILGPSEWLDDPYYSGDLGSFDAQSRTGCWPATRKSFVDAAGGDFSEVIFTGALGVGKSDLAIRLTIYWLYVLSCYVSPQALLGLQEHSVVVFMLIHMHKQKAERKLYAPMRGAIRRIPYFKENFASDPKIESNLIFPKGIELRCGITDPEAVRSEDLVVLVVDECNFFDVTSKSARDKEGRTFDAAEEIYNTAKRRQLTRFGGTSLWSPKIIMLSSRDRPDDFLERREREIRSSAVVSGPPDDQTVKSERHRAIVMSKALWKAKPPGSYPAETFTVEVGGDGRKSRLLPEGDIPTEGSMLVEVPDSPDFRDAFKNVDNALRELAGIAIAGVGRLFPNEAIIDAAIIPGEHPFTKLTTNFADGAEPLFEVLFENGAMRCCPKRWRFIHIDPAVTQDALGFGCLHVHGAKRVLRASETNKGTYVERVMPVFRVDLVLQVLPPSGGEIRLASAEELVYTLQEHGMKIGFVTFDTYQTVSMKQNLEAKNIPCDKLSVDKLPEPYLNMRDAFEEGRVEIYSYPPLLTELKALIYYRHLGKVDHVPRGSKDASDTIAGAMAKATEWDTFSGSDGDVGGVRAEVLG